MFRPVLKKKNQISDEKVKDLLKNSRRGVLSINGDDGYPYGLPINYLYDPETEKIYFHGAPKGHKVDSLKKSDKVCFTVVGPEVIKEETWAPYVQSAVVFGRCHFVEDRDQAMKILKAFAMKYYPSEEMVMDEIRATGAGVQIFEISIDHMSGKEVQER